MSSSSDMARSSPGAQELVGGWDWCKSVGRTDADHEPFVRVVVAGVVAGVYDCHSWSSSIESQP